MSYISKALFPAGRIDQGSDTSAVIYDPPANTKARISELLFATHEDDAYVSLWLTEDTDAVSNDNLILYRMKIPKGVPWAFPMDTFMNANQRLQGAAYDSASGSDVGQAVIQVSGTEFPE